MIRFAQYSETPRSSVPRRNADNIPLEGDLRLHETPQFCLGANLSGQSCVNVDVCSTHILADSTSLLLFCSPPAPFRTSFGENLAHVVKRNMEDFLLFPLRVSSEPSPRREFAVLYL